MRRIQKYTDSDDDEFLFSSQWSHDVLVHFHFSLMSTLRVASLNINGGRDQQKRLLVSNNVSQKKLDVLFLQETLTERQ